MELTVSFEKNIESAHLKKTTRYRDLTSDLKNKGWVAECVAFEIGSRGHISQRNKKSILDTLKNFKIKVQNKKLLQDISKISLLCSFSLFQAHCQPSWQSPPYLHPQAPLHCTAACWRHLPPERPVLCDSVEPRPCFIFSFIEKINVNLFGSKFLMKSHQD